VTSVISADQSAPMRGLLNLHGVTKPIDITPKISWVGTKMTVEGEFPVKLSDFNVPVPALLGVRIGNEITIRFTFVFDAQ